MPIKTQKYRIAWPLNAEQAENIDAMFEDLYRQLGTSIIGRAPNLGSFDVGDLVYIDSGGDLDGLDIGAAGTLLQSDGSLPTWTGFTFPTSFTTGDIIYASSATVLSKLAGVATGNALISGGVGTAPSWGKIALTTHVSGTLPVTNGGTGLATFNQGDLIYASAANTLAALAKDTNATRYLSNTGASNAPAWAQVALATGVSGDLPFANFVQASAASKLVGRGSASGAGDFEEITLGSGLSMSGTTLSATASGSGGSWSVLTNGDTADPELIFASGDVVMINTP